MSVKLTSQKAKPIYNADEAWFYESGRSIEVYVHKGNVIMAAKITRAKLKDWLKRTEPNKSNRGGANG